MAKADAAVVFTLPAPPLATLISDADAIQGLLDDRAAFFSRAAQLTVAILQARDAGEADLNDEAGYVSGKAKDDEAIIKLAGMGVTDDIATPVGYLPCRLNYGQGDRDGRYSTSDRRCCSDHDRLCDL